MIFVVRMALGNMPVLENYCVILHNIFHCIQWIIKKYALYLTLFRYIEDEDQLAHLPNSQYQAIVTTVDEVRIWKCRANINGSYSYYVDHLGYIF